MSEKHNIFIGIDVSKASLDISIDKKHFKIQNNFKDISSFIKEEISLKKIAPILVCLESTGGYENLAVEAFQNASVAIHKAHPNKVHAFARASGHFAKTDKLDAKLLEKYAAFVSDEQKGDIALSKATLELQALRNVERDLMDNLHAVQCRMKLMKGKSLVYLEEQVEFIKKQIERLREDMEHTINSDNDLKEKQDLLVSYKGVGKQVSNTLLAELPELGSLNHKEIASLVGVAPKLFHSGIKTPSGHIFGGRFYVRKALYMAALVATRYNEEMKVFYQRLLQVGKAKKIALTAVMRKIIVCLNAMVKNGTTFLVLKEEKIA